MAQVMCLANQCDFRISLRRTARDKASAGWMTGVRVSLETPPRD